MATPLVLHQRDYCAMLDDSWMTADCPCNRALCAGCCLVASADYVKRYATPGCSAASSSKASDDGSDDKMDDDGQAEDSDDGFLTSSEEEDA